MTQEQPLVSIGEIAKFLNVSKSTARRTLKKYHVPVFYVGNFVSVIPSELIRRLRETETTLQKQSEPF